MKKNYLYIVAVLIVAAIGTHFLNQPKNQNDDPYEGKSIAQNLYHGDFDSLEISTPDNIIHLEKKEDLWIIKEENGFFADTEKLSKLLSSLNTIPVISKISSKEEKFSKFKLYQKSEKKPSSETGTTLLFKKEKKTVFGVVFGKNRESKSTQPSGRYRSSGMYARLLSSNSSYLVKESLQIDDISLNWIIKDIAKIDKNNIQSILIKNGKKKLGFSRKEKGKDLIIKGLKKKEEIDKSKIDQLINLFSTISIESAIPKTSKKVLLSKSTVEIVVTTFAESKITFKMNKKSKDSEYMISINEELKGSDSYLINPSLSNNWIFKMAEYKGKGFLNSKKSYLKNK